MKVTYKFVKKNFFALNKFYFSVKRAVEDEQKRLKEEFEKIQRMSVIEQQAHFLYQDILNNILTLSCPRCKAAFVDFDGCFALTCTCGAGLCAYCLQDCGADAHHHVRTAHREGLFGTQEDFKAHQNRRRRVALEEKLRHQSREIKDLIRDNLNRELRGLGIELVI